jgi:hypothetical protein
MINIASVRSPLGNSNIIEILSKLLETASVRQQVDFEVQALRVLGNLCFDNGKVQKNQKRLWQWERILTLFQIESNRKRVKDAGIISIAANWFKTERHDLIRTICGFYLNSSMDYGKKI